MTSEQEDYDDLFNHDADYEKTLEDDDFDIADLNENQRKMLELELMDKSKKNMANFTNDINKKHQEKIQNASRNRKLYAIHKTSTTLLAAYASRRLKDSDIRLNWPLEMAKIINYLNKKYDRTTLVTELTLVMLELCLKKAPIQLSWDRGDGDILDLETPGVIDYEDRCFDSAIEIIIDLIENGIISSDPEKNELRIPIEIINSRKKK